MGTWVGHRTIAGHRRHVGVRQATWLCLVTTSSVAMTGLTTTGAWAQSAAEPIVLEEIVVTAQKRLETAQEVPIAITAFNADMLESRGVSGPQDLQHTTPGIVFSDSPTGVGLVTVRGVGGAASRGSSPGRNPAVPVHVNGVYLQSPAVMLQDFLDIDRVEILRGPQGTLYGRNAVGGSINVITKKPTDTTEGEIGIGVGNYDLRRVQGVLSGPLTDRLRGRIAFSVQDRDGYVENIDDPGDDKLLNANSSNLRGTLEYDLTDDILISVAGFSYDQNGSSHTIRPRTLPAVDFTTPSMYNLVPASYKPISFSDSRKVQHDTRGDGFDKTSGLTADVAWNLDEVTLRSITGYFDMKTGNTYDADGIDLPTVKSVGYFRSTYETFSQELQLASDPARSLRWLFGGYYYHEDSASEIFVDASKTIVPYVVDFKRPNTVKSESLAAFGQIDYSVTEDFNLTAGLRYTHDSMDVVRSGAFYLMGAPVFSFSNLPASESWSKVTWKLGANYDLTDNAMAYASYSRGYKSGGFNLQDTNPAFSPEILDAYEVGLKSQLANKRLQLNGAFFYYDYSDKQESKADATGFSVFENAGAATLYGAEIELLARVTAALTVDGSVSYLHSKYDEYKTADPENLAAGVQDLAGNKLTEAPKWQVHLGAQYEVPLEQKRGTLTARFDYSYTADKYVRAFNLPSDRLKSYGRSNARLWWENDGRDWTVEIYVDNIENNDVVNSFSETSPFAGNSHIEVFLPPRTYGLKVNHRF